MEADYVEPVRLRRSLTVPDPAVSLAARPLAVTGGNSVCSPAATPYRTGSAFNPDRGG